MNARTVTVLDVDQDVQAARNATRSILAAADNLSAAAALRPRVDKAAAIAAAHAATVDRESRFPQEAIAALRAERLLGIAVPEGVGRRGREHLRNCRCLLRARPRLRVDRDDLCDAPDEGRLHRAPSSDTRPGSAWHQALLRRLAAEQLLLASSTTEGQSGGDVRNSAAPIERNGAAHQARASGDGHFLRQGRRRHRHHGAAHRRRAELRSGARCVSQGRLHARSGFRLGCFRHARHLQRGLQARRFGCERADPAGRLRQDSRPDHDAGRASVLELGLGRHRRRRLWRARGISCARRRSARAARCRRPPRI